MKHLVRPGGGLSLLALMACAPPQDRAVEAVCEVLGTTVDDGVELLHYQQELDADGLLRAQERWVHGASTRSRSEFLYASGARVHQRDDLDGDGRVEVVTDWVRDADGLVLQVDEEDRVARVTHTLLLQWEGEVVVWRQESNNGVMWLEQRTELDAFGRPIEQITFDGAGAVLMRWIASYRHHGTGLDRHRLGWTGELAQQGIGGVFVDVEELFDEANRLVEQSGVVDGYERSTHLSYQGDLPLQEVTFFGDLLTLKEWSYDPEGHLVEEREELWAADVRVDELVTTWERRCP